MWLLKLHIAVSILCLLTFYGFKTVFKEMLEQNGYLKDKNKAKKKVFWIFFVPILNVACVVMLFVMLTMTKEELTKWCEDHKKNKNKGE